MPEQRYDESPRSVLNATQFYLSDSESDDSVNFCWETPAQADLPAESPICPLEPERILRRPDVRIYTLTGDDDVIDLTGDDDVIDLSSDDWVDVTSALPLHVVRSLEREMDEAYDDVLMPLREDYHSYVGTLPFRKEHDSNGSNKFAPSAVLCSCGVYNCHILVAKRKGN